MNWRATVLVTGLLLVSLGVSAESVFDAPVHNQPQRIAKLQALADKLGDQRPINGQFEQHKQLAILSRPLISGGEFQLDASGDFRWQVLNPYKITYHQQDGLLKRELDGVSEQVNPADEPALYGFFQFFSGIFDLDYPSLAAMFTVYFTEADDGSWQLGLVPENARLRRAIDRLIIQGEPGMISQVNLFEPGDDSTRIVFSYPPEPSAP
ncbi:MAG TPA: outer membrane lipoprotein carrier protein LolA [Cellvibrionaceae bacterium]